MNLKEFKKLMEDNLYTKEYEEFVENINDGVVNLGPVFGYPAEYIEQQVDDMDGDWRLYLNVFKFADLTLGVHSTYSSWGDNDEQPNPLEAFEVEEHSVVQWRKKK